MVYTNDFSISDLGIMTFQFFSQAGVLELQYRFVAVRTSGCVNLDMCNHKGKATCALLHIELQELLVERHGLVGAQ